LPKETCFSLMLTMAGLESESFPSPILCFVGVSVH
jgi:hypothetical protein